jgi:uncharacterized protein YxeA
MRTKKEIFILSILSILLITSIVYNVFLYNETREKSAIISREEMQYEEEIEELKAQRDNYYYQYNELAYEKAQQIKKQKYSSPQINFFPSVYYKTSYEVDLKTDFSPGCAVLTTIPAGVKVEVTNSFLGDKWEVNYQGKSGWVESNALERL